jgi:hypothetical protein
MNRASEENRERVDAGQGSRPVTRGHDTHHSQERLRTSDPITKVVSKVAKARPSFGAEPASSRPSQLGKKRHQISTRPDLPAARKRAWSCLEYHPGKANDNGSALWEPEPFAPLASVEPPPLASASAAPSSAPSARESVAPSARTSVAPSARESAAPSARTSVAPSAPKRASHAPASRPSVAPPPVAVEPRPALAPPPATRSPKPSSRPLPRAPFEKADSAHPAAIHSAPTVAAMASVRPAAVSSSRPVRRAAPPPALLDYGPAVHQVVLSESGRLLNSTHGSDDELLAETVGFTHRLATLTARALGFAGCHAMYLRSATAAIIVREREPALVGGVSGKVESLSHALAEVGLE